MVSGLDTDSLVEAAVAQKTARADTMEAKVEANEAKIAAYQELQGLVSDISDALSGLKSTTYSALGSGNAFDDKSASLSASDGSTATSYLSVDVESSAAAGEYDLTVVQLAKAMKIAGATADGTTALGLTGGFSIGVEGGEASTIAVTADMTLEDIADALSDVSAKTGVNATLIKISSTEYRLVLTAADTDVAIVASVTDGDDVLSAIGLTGEEGAFANVIQDAQPAIITVDGVTVSRSTNELTDVIPGVSISLEAATEGQRITLAIEPDYAAVKTAVTDFITAYNALRAFISTQQTVESDGSVAADAVLFADSVLRTLGKAVSGLITGSGDGDISGLSDLGITINASNQLVLSDETALNNAILSNADAFQAFFETQFTTSNSALKLMTNDSTLSLDFTLEVTVGGDGAISDVTVDGVAGLFTVSGSRITGAKGTIYEGLTFALAAASSTSIDVSIQQGFADLMVNLMDAYGDSGSGLLQMRIDSLETIDTDLQTRADKIRSDGEAYRQVLIDKYAAMEAEIQAAELLQQQIEAILGGGSDDD
jgi:flagellar hook-associated protein 2